MSQKKKTIRENSRLRLTEIREQVSELRGDPCFAAWGASIELVHETSVIFFAQAALAGEVKQRRLDLVTRYGTRRRKAVGTGTEWVVNSNDMPAADWLEYNHLAFAEKLLRAEMSANLENFVSAAAAIFRSPLRGHFLWLIPNFSKALNPDQLHAARLKCPHVDWK